MLAASRELKRATERGVVVDLGSRLISIDQHQASLRRFRTRQSIGPRYVELVHLARGMHSPERFSLRGADMYEIGLALNLPASFIRRDVRKAMAFIADGKTSGSGLIGYIAPASGIAIASTVAVGLYGQLVDSRGAPSFSGANSTESLSGQEFAAAIVSESTLNLSPVVTSPVVTSPVATSPAEQFSPPAATRALPNYELVGQEALSLLSYDWETKLAGWSIDFESGRDGLLGYAFFDEQRIEIYVQPSHSPAQVAATLAHELGHAVDVTLLSNDDRESWADQRSITSTWWPEAAGSDFASGAGDFAEAFATWQVGEVSRSEVSGQPTPDQLALLASLAT